MRFSFKPQKVIWVLLLLLVTQFTVISSFLQFFILKLYFELQIKQTILDFQILNKYNLNPLKECLCTSGISRNIRKI